MLLNTERANSLFFLFYMKKLQNKLSLNKQTLSVLTAREQNSVRGGQLDNEEVDGGDGYFLSIGCCCSKANHCDRTLTRASC